MSQFSQPSSQQSNTSRAESSLSDTSNMSLIDQWHKIEKLISECQFAMMSTVCEDGSLRSRPMATMQKAAQPGELWFFTRNDAPKLGEIKRDQHVNLNYISGKSTYVSVSGIAEESNDRQKMTELWNEAYKAWFPEGLNDPHLGLLRVKASYAEIWDTTSPKLTQFLGTIKAAVTGQTTKPNELGQEHYKFEQLNKLPAGEKSETGAM